MSKDKKKKGNKKMTKSNKSKTRRRELNDQKRDTRKMTFAFKTDLANSFVELAENLGYNNTEALELLMQKAIEGLLPRKVTSYIKELTPEEKEFRQLDHQSRLMFDNMQQKIHNALVLLRGYMAKENQLESVVKGPNVEEIFGSLKVYVALNTGKVIAVDIEKQELQFITERQESGEVNDTNE